MASFTVRINDDDHVDLAAFDEAARELETNREELVRQLMRRFLARFDQDEQYYTIKAWNSDHTQDAYIHNMDGHVTWNSNGIEWQSREWKLLEHAVELVERGELLDKEEAIKLFQDIFGERNVFVKDE